jgi:hypothetical protein
MDLLVTENVFYGRDAQVRAGVRVLLLAHGSAASGVGEAELCCRAGMRGQRQRLAWGAASRACATRAVRGVTYCTIAVPQVSRIYDLKGSQRDRYAADNPAVAGVCGVVWGGGGMLRACGLPWRLQSGGLTCQTAQALPPGRPPCLILACAANVCPLPAAARAGLPDPPPPAPPAMVSHMQARCCWTKT